MVKRSTVGSTEAVEQPLLQLGVCVNNVNRSCKAGARENRALEILAFLVLAIHSALSIQPVLWQQLQSIPSFYGRFVQEARQNAQEESFQVRRIIPLNIDAILTNNPAGATRRAAATSNPSVAQTAHDALPRTKRSRDSQSATWSNQLPSVRLLPVHATCISSRLQYTNNLCPQVIFPMHLYSQTTPSQKCTSSCNTASLAPFTERLCE